MDKRAHAFTVETVDGYICIQQNNSGIDDAENYLHPEQVDLLVKWLNEAKDELLNS